MHVESMERKMREMPGGVDADQALAMGAHTVCQFPCCPFSFRVPVSVAIVLPLAPSLARPLNCDGGDRCARVSASVCWDAMRGESHPLASSSSAETKSDAAGGQMGGKRETGTRARVRRVGRKKMGGFLRPSRGGGNRRTDRGEEGGKETPRRVTKFTYTVNVYGQRWSGVCPNPKYSCT